MELPQGHGHCPPATDKIKCSPCVFDRKTADAMYWCIVCQEGLCKRCTENHTRKNHLKIPVRGLSTGTLQMLSANICCQLHNCKVDIFCSSHDEAICSLCQKQSHKDCVGCAPIEMVSKPSKSSAEFYDLERSLEDTKQTLEKAIHSVIENRTSLVLSKCAIHQEIQIVRKDISEYLDKLEIKLLQETERKCKECFAKIDSMTKGLETDKKKVESVIVVAEDIKQLPTDALLFIGLHHTNRKFNEIKKEIEARLNGLQKFEMSLLLNPIIESFKQKIPVIGNIEVNASQHEIMMQDFKMRQAQIPVAAANKLHTNEYLQLEQEITILKDFKEQLITSCLILPNDIFIFIDRNHYKLVLQNSKGDVCQTFGIATGPYDACIVGEETVAVSYGSLACADIINLRNGKIIKRIKTSGFCSGVCYWEGRVYMVVKNKGVCTVEYPGGTISCLIKYPRLEIGYIAVTSEKIVFTNTGNKSLHCTNLDGNELWTFRLNEISPRGVQFDKYGNVLFVDSESDILSLVSADGENNQVILDSSDGLNCPFGIHYNNHTNQLLISNLADGRAFLFKCK